MEQENKHPRLALIAKILFFILALLLAMYLCATVAYRAVRKKAPQEQTLPDGASDSFIGPHESQMPFHLPAAVKTLVPAEPSSLPATDRNDYLVIAEDGCVHLYILNDDGELSFSSQLEIPFSNLLPEDQAVLSEGIILDSDTSLAAFLEDYSS